MSEYIITDEQIAENRCLHGRKLLVMPVVVRCRDCRYMKTCDIHHQMKMETGESADNGFCAWGERIEND